MQTLEFAKSRAKVTEMAGALSSQALIAGFPIARHWAVGLDEYAHMSATLLQEASAQGSPRVLAGSTVFVFGRNSRTPGYGSGDAHFALAEPQVPGQTLVKPTVVAVTDGNVAVMHYSRLPRVLAAQTEVDLRDYTGSEQEPAARVLVERGGNIMVGLEGVAGLEKIPLEEYSPATQRDVLLSAGSSLARSQFALKHVITDGAGVEKTLVNQ